MDLSQSSPPRACSSESPLRSCTHLCTDRHIAVRVHSLANGAKRSFKVARCCPESMCIDCQGGADHDERCTVSWRIDGLLDREPAHCLHGNRNRSHNLFQAVEWSRRPQASFALKISHVVTDMVDDVVTAELFQSLGSIDGISHGHVIAHDFDSKITPC